MPEGDMNPAGVDAAGLETAAGPAGSGGGVGVPAAVPDGASGAGVAQQPAGGGPGTPGSSGSSSGGSAGSGRAGVGVRRRRVVGGRSRRFEVRVTVEEEARLVALAGRYGMSVPRLLFTAAVGGGGEAAAARRDAVAELFAVGRVLAGIGTNMNQVATVANSTGVVPPQHEAVVDAIRRVLWRVEAAVDAVARA